MWIDTPRSGELFGKVKKPTIDGAKA